MGSNNTIVIQTSLLSLEKLDEIKQNQPISGYSYRVEDMLNFQVVFPQEKAGYSDHQILIMSVNDWEKRREDMDGEASDIAGAILLDEDIYRPSSPLKDVTKTSDGDSSPIMYLVREEDKLYIDRYINHSTPLDIVLDRNMIPTPTWKCDLGPHGCLPDKYNNGYVAGYQYLSQKCYWGGKPCHDQEHICFKMNGYKMTNAAVSELDDFQCVQDYCDGFYETLLCDLDGKGFGKFELLVINGNERRFRWSPRDYCARRVDDIESECDKASPGWTNFLGNRTIEFPTQNIAEVERRRYCSVKNKVTGQTECIFEEEDISFCCQDPEKDCHGSHFC